MTKKANQEGYRGPLQAAMRWLAGVALRCTGRPPRLFAPMQPDGYSAQPIGIVRRFTADADLDPDTHTPVGDEGYFLHILNEAAHWDYSTTRSLLFSIWQRPWGHSWLLLESPENRWEFGHTGDLGLVEPRYHDGVFQQARAGHPDAIAYLWQTRSDGIFQTGKPKRPPTFVWQMPITRRRHQRIHEYVMQRNYDPFGVTANNCTDMVIEVAALAGIHLVHRIRLTGPKEVSICGQRRRVWTDPKYRILEYSTPEVLEADLRHLVALGVGRNATAWYLGLKK